MELEELKIETDFSTSALIQQSDRLHLLNRDEVLRLFGGTDQDSLTSMSNFQSHLNEFQLREYFIKECSFAIPCFEAVSAIKKHNKNQPLIDVMAGSGYWAYILNQAGIKTLAFDKAAAGKGTHGQKHYKNFPMQKQDALDTIKLYENSDVLLCWPPYNEDIGYKIVRALKIGNFVFYIGEGLGGCTGDDEMHKYLDENFKEIDCVHLPQFIGIHDALFIYKKS